MSIEIHKIWGKEMSVGCRDRKIAAKSEIINSMLEVYFPVGRSHRTMLSNYY